MNKEEFIKELRKIKIEITKEQSKQLEEYSKLLQDYNKHTNITSITEPEAIFLKHFYDSLTIVKVIDLLNYQTLLDIGSGGGFPGIVLKIVFPHLKVTLLDSNNKKSQFQKFIINKLSLNNIEVINERAEIYYKTNNKYDIVTARAVSNLNILSELAIPFVKKNGYFIAMKGEVNNELIASTNAIKKLGGEIEETITFKLPIEYSIRTLIKIKKITETPNIYPRTYDKIIKKTIK